MGTNPHLMARHLYYDLSIHNQDGMKLEIRELGSDRLFGIGKAIDPRNARHVFSRQICDRSVKDVS